jgi:bla regulator protein BlaR1
MIPIFILLIFLLVVYLNRGNNQVAPDNGLVENTENYPDITIQSPIIISSNSMYPIIGKFQYLRLKMVKGKYYENWTPGPYMGTIWEGYYNIELIDDSGNIISQIELNKIYKEPLIFTSFFDIQFDEYNNDGDIDFTIGQYATSNGNEYKLFTLRKDGKIELLPINGYSSLFISDTTGYYSTKLTKLDNGTFKKEYYDNTKGKNVDDIFKWNGTEFIKN